ncbi:MAG TPA: trigger factor [Pseudonocardiaceae bacterium]|nr:trigger factor [Pseudonocardiaceae bacterium]
MKSTVEQLSPTRVKINVEVPFDELKPDFDRAYKKIAQQVNIPGFRPGRAPAKILEQRLGRGVVLEEVVNGVIPAKYAEIVSAGEVHPLGRPEIEVTKIEDGDSLEFTAEVDVRPQIEMPAFTELAVSVEDVEVTDAEVEEQLDGLRSRFGTLTAVERPVQEKDFVVLDLSATVDGEEIADLATTDLSYQIGSGELIEGIDDVLVGASQGDGPTFTTTLAAGEYAGREAEVTAKIQAVKERELPAADDEFAQLASEFDTLEELRADLRTRLGRVKSMQQGVKARDEVLKALLDATEVPLPAAVVESEYKARKHDALHAFDHDEQRLGRWLEQQGHSPEEFETDLRKGASETVKAHLLLDAIADAEELSVSDGELSERIVYQAQRRGVSPNEYAQQAHESGELGTIYADVRRGKALATVVRQASVTDGSGNAIDVDALIDAAKQQ